MAEIHGVIDADPDQEQHGDDVDEIGLDAEHTHQPEQAHHGQRQRRQRQERQLEVAKSITNNTRMDIK